MEESVAMSKGETWSNVRTGYHVTREGGKEGRVSYTWHSNLIHVFDKFKYCTEAFVQSHLYEIYSNSSTELVSTTKKILSPRFVEMLSCMVQV